MKILVACEESQAVTIELRKLGHGLPKKERSKARLKTFPGIAKAMAMQWTGVKEGANA